MTEDSGTFKTNSADFTPNWPPKMNEQHHFWPLRAPSSHEPRHQIFNERPEAVALLLKRLIRRAAYSLRRKRGQ